MADVVLINPGPNHTSPQGRYRPRVSIALKKNEHRPTRAHRRAFARVMSGVPVVTQGEYDETACRFQGYRYSQRCDRCGGKCGSFDCSGLQCHVCDLLGIGIGCQTSFTMSALAFDHGLIIPLATARSLQSHWAVKGRDLGRRPGPNDEGHIVDGRGLVLVNGLWRPETMEAMGTKWGCLIGSWDGRNWAAAYRIPGVLYGPPAPPFKSKERDMILQQRAGSPPGRKCGVGVSDDGTYIEGWNGANIRGDQHNAGDPPNLRRWYPKASDGKTLFLGAGQHYKGIAAHLDGSGVTAFRNDGASVDGDWGSL